MTHNVEGKRPEPILIRRHDEATCMLYREDCLLGMRDRLAPGSVDVVVTSPPYNIGTRYRVYDDTTPREHYLDWMENVAHVLHEVLADAGSVFLNLGGKPSDPWGPHEVLARLRPYFVLQNEIHLITSIVIDADAAKRRLGLDRDLAVGHYKPINSRRYLHTGHEYIFHLTKHGDVALDRLAIGTPYQDKSNVRRWGNGNDDLRCRGNVWFIPYPTIQNRDTDRPHPASFPVTVPRWCIQLHGVSRTRRVLDPFLGLGTTAVACQELGVDFVGFEIDETYLEAAVERLTQPRPNGTGSSTCGPLDFGDAA